jgi:hypothetical protein
LLPWSGLIPIQADQSSKANELFTDCQRCCVLTFDFVRLLPVTCLYTVELPAGIDRRYRNYLKIRRNSTWLIASAALRRILHNFPRFVWRRANATAPSFKWYCRARSDRVASSAAGVAQERAPATTRLSIDWLPGGVDFIADRALSSESSRRTLDAGGRRNRHINACRTVKLFDITLRRIYCDDDRCLFIITLARATIRGARPESPVGIVSTDALTGRRICGDGTCVTTRLSYVFASAAVADKQPTMSHYCK